MGKISDIIMEVSFFREALKKCAPQRCVKFRENFIKKYFFIEFSVNRTELSTFIYMKVYENHEES